MIFPGYVVFAKKSPLSSFRYICNIKKIVRAKMEKNPKRSKWQNPFSAIMAIFGLNVRGEGIEILKNPANMVKIWTFYFLKTKKNCDLLYSSSSTTYLKNSAFFPNLVLRSPYIRTKIFPGHAVSAKSSALLSSNHTCNIKKIVRANFA